MKTVWNNEKRVWPLLLTVAAAFWVFCAVGFAASLDKTETVVEMGGCCGRRMVKVVHHHATHDCCLKTTTAPSLEEFVLPEHLNRGQRFNGPVEHPSLQLILTQRNDAHQFFPSVFVKPWVFVPLQVMGPAHASHAPPHQSLSVSA